MVRKIYVGSSEVYDLGGDLIGGIGKCYSGGFYTSVGSFRYDVVVISFDGILVKESLEIYEKGFFS